MKECYEKQPDLEEQIILLCHETKALECFASMKILMELI